MNWTRLLFLAAALAAAPALHAHSGPMDTRFGEGGFAHYGFQAVNGQQGDAARVGCPGAGDTFVVVGAASSGQRIVTVRLRPDGSFDDTFSGDGKESFDLPTSFTGSTASVCLGQSGDPVMVGTVVVSAGERNLRVVRVGRDTGLPVAGFGNGGVVDLDLDAHLPGLGGDEVPLGLNALPNGDLAISGYAALANGSSSGFVALLNAAGQVRAVTLTNCWMLTTVLESPAGALWAFGSAGNGACRLTLDRNTLAQSARLDNNLGATLRPGAARAVRPGTVVMAAAILAPYGYRPALAVFRETEVTTVALPAPVLHGSASSLSAIPGVHGVQVLPGGRVLFGGTLLQTETSSGEYFALARIGRSAADDRGENYWGDGGALAGQFRPTTPACNAAPPSQEIYRMTMWQGRPTFVGRVETQCFDNAGADYLVGRVETDYLFGDGWD